METVHEEVRPANRPKHSSGIISGIFIGLVPENAPVFSILPTSCELAAWSLNENSKIWGSRLPTSEIYNSARCASASCQHQEN